MRSLGNAEEAIRIVADVCRQFCCMLANWSTTTAEETEAAVVDIGCSTATKVRLQEGQLSLTSEQI